MLDYLKQQLIDLLIKKEAHVTFEEAVANFPEEHINTVPPGCVYSFWHVLEHMRIDQLDLITYIQSETYHPPTFPDDLWPDKTAQITWNGWQQTIASFLADRQIIIDIVRNPQTDIFAPLPHSGEHQYTLLWGVGLVARHNSYHLGGFVMMRKSVGLWPAPQAPQ